MPLLEASLGPQWGRHRLQGVSLATESSKVAGPQLCPPSSTQPPTPSGVPPNAKALQVPDGTGPWASLTETVAGGGGGAGICGGGPPG